MHRFSGFDTTLASAVRWCYLLGLALGFYAFFLGQSATVPDVVNNAVATTLMAAVALHEFLAGRAFTTYWQSFVRQGPADPRRRATILQLTVTGIIMLVLLAFDIFMSLSYVAHNAYHIALFGAETEIYARGYLVAILFFVSTFMVRVNPDAATILEAHATDMLYKAVKVGKHQWNKRLNDAERAGQNFAPILITLMDDAGETDSAKRIRMIEQGLRETERGDNTRKYPKSYSPQLRSLSRAEAIALPIAISRPNGHTNDVQNGHVEEGKLPTVRKPRKLVKRTPQERVFTLLDRDDSQSISDLVRVTKLNRKTVSLYFKQWHATHDMGMAAEG